MRILFLTNFLPPEHTGGTELFTYTTAQWLQEVARRVQVVCGEKWGR
jgi:hypothetical protein